MVCDINGLELGKGDVVAPVSGDMKGKVCGVKTEDGEGFVCVRAAHRPYSKGVWYAAEHVQRLAIGKVRPRANGKAEDNADAATANGSNGKAKTSSNGDAKAGRNGSARKEPTANGARKSQTRRSGRRAVTTH